MPKKLSRQSVIQLSWDAAIASATPLVLYCLDSYFPWIVDTGSWAFLLLAAERRLASARRSNGIVHCLRRPGCRLTRPSYGICWGAVLK